MPNEHEKEHGPIEDESSLVEQSIVEATIILQEVIDEYPHSIDIEDLKEIMTHLEDAHTALDTEALPTGDHEGERQAEADAERQAEACYDDLEGGWY